MPEAKGQSDVFRPGGSLAAPAGGSDVPSPPPAGAAHLAFPREEDIRLAQDLLFFAYRDFTNAADVILEELGLGRAHHRALHFVGRNPGITVSELLAILRITKQSLARVLGALVDQGYVAQAQGNQDRRQRLLTLTPAGQALEHRLFQRQRARLAVAYRDAGEAAVDGFRSVMQAIMDEEAFRNIAEAHGAVRLGLPSADALRVREAPMDTVPAGESPAGPMQPGDSPAGATQPGAPPAGGAKSDDTPPGAVRLAPVERS